MSKLSLFVMILWVALAGAWAFALMDRNMAISVPAVDSPVDRPAPIQARIEHPPQVQPTRYIAQFDAPVCVFLAPRVDAIPTVFETLEVYRAPVLVLPPISQMPVGTPYGYRPVYPDSWSRDLWSPNFRPLVTDFYEPGLTVIREWRRW